MKLILMAAFAITALATPDCYNFTQGVSFKWNGYGEGLTPELVGKRADWMTIKPQENCGFYTFGDVYFASFHPNVTGIYLNFVTSIDSNGNSTCSLQSTNIQAFTSGTWLYANSTMADPTICGYYVGIANSDFGEQTFEIVRLATEAVPTGKITSISYYNLKVSTFLILLISIQSFL